MPERLLARLRRGYYAQIAHIDNQVGRLLIALRYHHAGPTWIVFTSEHGEMLGEHHLFRKTYAYEGSARTPLVICPPGGCARHVCRAPVVSEDLMPTILDMAGAAIPAGVEGRSLLPLLDQAPEAAAWRRTMHGEHSPCYAPDHGMQYLADGRMK